MGQGMMADWSVGLCSGVVAFLWLDWGVYFSGLLWDFPCYSYVWTEFVDLTWVQFCIWEDFFLLSTYLIGSVPIWPAVGFLIQYLCLNWACRSDWISLTYEKFFFCVCVFVFFLMCNDLWQHFFVLGWPLYGWQDVESQLRTNLPDTGMQHFCPDRTEVSVSDVRRNIAYRSRYWDEAFTL